MTFHRTRIALCALAFATLASSTPGWAANEDKPWLNPALDPDKRAELAVAQMTREEKQGLVFAYFGTDAPWKKFTTSPEAREARSLQSSAANPCLKSAIAHA